MFPAFLLFRCGAGLAEKAAVFSKHGLGVYHVYIRTEITGKF